ncbi:hypothetical protein ACWGDT_29655 [Streptomyces avermitilis]
MSSKETRKKVRISKPLEVVGDAMIASHLVGDGRLIPVLIVDTASRPDVEELVRVHQHISDGDCKSQWGQNLNDKDQVVLQLEFIRPMQVAVAIGIHVPTQGILIESILETQSLYLAPGRPGDRFISKQDSPRILVEVPRGGFGDIWEKLVRHALRKTFRDKGLSRPAARVAAEQMIEKSRELTSFRFKKLTD